MLNLVVFFVVSELSVVILLVGNLCGFELEMSLIMFVNVFIIVLVMFFCGEFLLRFLCIKFVILLFWFIFVIEVVDVISLGVMLVMYWIVGLLWLWLIRLIFLVFECVNIFCIYVNNCFLCILVELVGDMVVVYIFVL